MLPMAPQNVLKEAYDELRNVLMNLKNRVNEIRAFYKVWDEIFDELLRITGKEQQIDIANHNLLETFTNDKFHTIVSDLHSSLKSQINYQKSFIKLFGNDLNFENLDELKLDSNSKYQNQAIEEIRKISNGDKNRSIKDLISELISRLEPTRHSFNHRHEKMILTRYRAEEFINEIEEIDKILLEYMNQINNLGLIKFDTGFGINSEIIVLDYLFDIRDIILFGSIKAGIQKMNTNFEIGYEKKKEFLDLRKEYYKQYIVELIN